MLPKSFQNLINRLSSLPSVGPKMAERLVLFLFKKDDKYLEEFAESLKNLKKNISACQDCFNIAENSLCAICKDAQRNRSIICVVEEPLDVIALEKTRKMTGLYHVLGGTIISNEKKNGELKIGELIERAKKGKLEEIILATNPTTEGEATALYLARLLKPLNVKVTRLARGLPTGADIEYADEQTLTGAIEGRKIM